MQEGERGEFESVKRSKQRGGRVAREEERHCFEKRGRDFIAFFGRCRPESSSLSFRIGRYVYFMLTGPQCAPSSQMWIFINCASSSIQIIINNIRWRIYATAGALTNRGSSS